MKKAIVVALAAGALALSGVACSKKKETEKLLDGAVFEAPAPAVSPEPAPPKVEEPEKEIARANPESVQFDFDNYELSCESLDLLADIAAEMRQFPNLNIIIYGACCPIGSAEYNLALGEHRGLACRDYLAASGVERERIAVISWGEEESHILSFEPSKFWVNRRAEFGWAYTE